MIKYDTLFSLIKEYYFIKVKIFKIKVLPAMMKIEIETPIAPAKNKPLRKRKTNNEKPICSLCCCL